MVLLSRNECSALIGSVPSGSSTAGGGGVQGRVGAGAGRLLGGTRTCAQARSLGAPHCPLAAGGLAEQRPPQMDQRQPQQQQKKKENACPRSCGRPTARCAAGRTAAAPAPRLQQTPSRALALHRGSDCGRGRGQERRRERPLSLQRVPCRRSARWGVRAGRRVQNASPPHRGQQRRAQGIAAAAIAGGPLLAHPRRSARIWRHMAATLAGSSHTMQRCCGAGRSEARPR